MGDLNLVGPLNLTGMLTLNPDGGEVTVGGVPALVQLPPGGAAHNSSAAPVIIPPPPAGPPIDDGQSVWVINSFNQMVKAGDKPLVTLGIAMQGNIPTWPGMVLPSTVNFGKPAVTVNMIPINVKDDQAIILPLGAPAMLSESGQ